MAWTLNHANEMRLNYFLGIWHAAAQQSFDLCEGPTYEILFRNGAVFKAGTAESCFAAAAAYAEATKRLTGEYP